MRNFNETNGCSGFFKNAGKKLLGTTAITAAGLMALSGNAKAADWSDHTITSGSTTVDLSIPDETNITQLTHIVKAQGDADIKAGHTVNIAQPGSTSRYIVFDTELDPTIIQGALNANGEVFIFDQNGVIFGNDAVVDVGSIVASTGVVSDADLMDPSGELEFTGLEGSGDIVNSGSITVAEAGLAAFVAPGVENSGVINAKMGTVVMAAGETVTMDMYGDGLVEVAVDGELSDGLLENSGDIIARGGDVIVTAAVAKNVLTDVINMDGFTTVSSAQVKGGKIILSGGDSGRVSVRGNVQASGSAGNNAGDVDITGERVRVHADARVRANGGPGGDAGDINVIASDSLFVDGRISARGNDDTGFIETSAPSTTFGAGASILATREWLLDPTNIDIDTALAALLSAQLNIGDMTVQTNGAGGAAGNVHLLTGVGITKTAGTDSTFTINAHNDIRINGTITGTGPGALNVALNADFDEAGGVDGDVFVQNDINTNGGSFSVLASDDIDIKSGATVDTDGGDVSLVSRGRGGTTWLWMPGGSNDGHIETNGGDVEIQVSNIRLGNGSSIDAGTGNVTIKRDKVGTIGLGDALGDMRLGQGLLERIDAATLTIGGTNTTGIDVDGIDTTSSTIAGLVTLNALGAGGDINFDGTNTFAALAAEADDDIHVRNGSLIRTNDGGVSLKANNNVDDGVTVLQIEGTIDTVGAGALGDVYLEANNYFVEIDSTGAIVSPGRIDVKSNHGFDIDNGGTFIGSEGVHIDAPLVQLGDDIVTAGNITGTASTVKVENDDAQIQDGVDVSAEGAEITVAAGTYNESVNVNKNGLTLLGANAGTHGDDARVAESIVMPNSPGFYVTGDDVTIDGFMVDGAGADGNNGIEADGVTNFTAINNIVKNNTDTGAGRSASDWTTGIGILVQNSMGDILIQNNRAEDNTDGVRIYNTDAAALGDIVIRDNTIVDSGDKGIITKNSDNIRISANTVTGSKTGVWLENSDGNLVNNNDIDDTDENAIRLRNGSDSNEIRGNRIDGAGDNGIKIAGGDNNQLLNNHIDNVDDDGIDLDDSNENLIEGNRIGLNGGADNIGDDGIDLDDSDNNTIRNNRVSNTDDDGIDLTDSDENTIEDNKVGLNGGDDNIGDDGIDLDGSDNNTIRNNNIQNVAENGIDNQDSDGTDMIGNIIRFVGENGIYVNPSDDIRILDNVITDVEEDGIHSEEGEDIRVRRNTIRRTGDDGIDITRNDHVRVTGNTVTDTDRRGISVERSRGEEEDWSVVVAGNTVKRTGRTSIVVDRFTTARIVDNIVRDSNRVGIRAQRGDNARIRRNDVRDTRRDGIKAVNLDEVEIRRNIIRNARWDGIFMDDFGFGWISKNDIRNTGDDNIHASEGEYVAIYDNILRKAGFFEDGDHADEHGADAIYVTDVDGDVPDVALPNHLTDDGYIYYGFNTDILGNDINRTYDDGIEVTYGGPTWVGENIIRHIGYGDDTSYDGGDYYGADGVHLRGISGLPEGSPVITLRAADRDESGFFPTGAPTDYSSVVVFNNIRVTADDGVEVVGMDITAPTGPTPTATADGDGDGCTHCGDGEPVESSRTLVAWNEIRHAGYGVDGDGDGGDGDGDGGSYGYAPDGYGADAVHVRGITNGNAYVGDGDGAVPLGDGCGDGDGATTMHGPAAAFDPNLFAVEVLNNYIWNTGDDGIEVRDSGRTRVATNQIYNTGLATSDTTAPIWTSGWDFGANDGDGIHIENVRAPLGTIVDHSTYSVFFGTVGNSVEVLSNYVDHTGDDGAEIHYSGRTLVEGNTFTNIGVGDTGPYHGGDEGYGHDAVHVGGGYDDYDLYEGTTNTVVVRRNLIDTTGDDGIEVHFAGRTLIENNHISNVGYSLYDSGATGRLYGLGDEYGADAIHVAHVMSNDNNAPFSVDIKNNVIRTTADDGIEVINSSRTRIRKNDLANIGSGGGRDYGGGDIYGADGIHVRNVNSTSERERQMDVRIVRNKVIDAADDGVEVLGTDRVLVRRNTIDMTGDDGISVLRHDLFEKRGLHASAVRIYDPEIPSKAVIDRNRVTNAGTPFPESDTERSIRRPGGDGIQVGGFDKIKVTTNEVSNSVENGLFVSGPNNGKVEVSGNTFTDNDIGAHFQSGEIDLTGEGNIFDGGRVGMRFAPFAFDIFDISETAFAPSAISSFAPLSLVDDDGPGGFGGTIGAQSFDGQSEFFVELDNGAFFEPGTPTILNALDSTFAGTPLGTVTPSVDFPTGMPLELVAFLEERFFHFNDDGSLGLFFFPLLPGIDQEDIFNYFGPYGDGLAGLNVTILGLPGIPGNPVALADIAPFAGGDGETDPAALNAIETAAGDEEASCWGDAVNAAGAGQSVNLSYGGGAEALLNGEASCGS